MSKNDKNHTENIRHSFSIEPEAWRQLNDIAKNEEFIPVNALIIKLINQRIAQAQDAIKRHS